jgi:hypothetical protein
LNGVNDLKFAFSIRAWAETIISIRGIEGGGKEKVTAQGLPDALQS